MTDTKPATPEGLMVDLASLWYGEGCELHFDYDETSMGREWAWTVRLEWLTDGPGNPHQADWVRYAWVFYGSTLDEAIAAALEWAQGLVPFARCESCDGRGWYGAGNAPKPCEDCGGSGLAHNPEPADTVTPEPEPEPPMSERDIVERIMTMHWDLAACPCWVCEAGRAAGCRPRDYHLQYKLPKEERLGDVHVDDDRVRWVPQRVETAP